MFDADAGDAGIITQHFVQRVEGLEFDLACGNLLHHVVHQDGFGRELIAPVHQRDLCWRC